MKALGEIKRLLPLSPRRGLAGLIVACAVSTSLADAPAWSATLPVAWGFNDTGQLGNGRTTNSSVPITVKTSGVLAGKTITAIAAGLSHSLALGSDGKVYTWGDNIVGQLGDGTTSDSSVPVAADSSGVLVGRAITAIAAGTFHSLALATEFTCPTITVSPSTLLNGTVGVAYSQTFTATGGVAPYRFTVAAGALPAGLTLSSAGVLSGTPTTVSKLAFTVRATDANGCLKQKFYTLHICPVITLSPTTRALPAGKVGVSYAQAITATGGKAPYSFTLAAGTLPGGLTLSAGGALSGTPTAAGDFAFTVRARDADGCRAFKGYTIHINP